LVDVDQANRGGGLSQRRRLLEEHGREHEYLEHGLLLVSCWVTSVG
jgi:hypothetical protein